MRSAPRRCSAAPSPRRHTTRHTACVRSRPHRSAADAERARRSLPRQRGVHRGDDAAGTGIRRGGRGVPSPRNRDHEILDLQADPGAGRRGARMPRRQRVRRGFEPSSPLPREPAQFTLGGRRERHRARRSGALDREPESLEVVRAEILLARGAERRLDVAFADLEAELADGDLLEYRARRLVEHLALCLQASLLVRHAPAEVADAFCAARLAGGAGRRTAPCRPESTRARSSSGTRRTSVSRLLP